MTPHKFRLSLYTVTSLVLMAVIFWFSSQNGVESQSLSDGLLYDILVLIGLEDAAQIEFYGKLIRKLAHFAMYGALGLSLTLFFTELAGNTRSALKNGTLRGFAVSALYAAGDELHQYFVPGRSMQFADVLLDCAGALTAILLLVLLKKFIYSQREERKNFE